MFEKIKNEIIRRYPNAEVYLYGSYAKGTQKPDSDIDISIKVKPGEVQWRYNPQLSDDLSKLVGKEVNVVFCTQDNEFNLLRL